MFRFRGFDCEVVLKHYVKNYQPALILQALPTKNNLNKFAPPGEPICKATRCFTNYLFAKNETAISNEDGNKGVLTVLMDYNIVRPLGKIIIEEEITYSVVEVLDKSKWGKHL